MVLVEKCHQVWAVQESSCALNGLLKCGQSKQGMSYGQDTDAILNVAQKGM